MQKLNSVIDAAMCPSPCAAARTLSGWVPPRRTAGAATHRALLQLFKNQPFLQKQQPVVKKQQQDVQVVQQACIKCPQHCMHYATHVIYYYGMACSLNPSNFNELHAMVLCRTHQLRWSLYRHPRPRRRRCRWWRWPRSSSRLLSPRSSSSRL